MNPQVRDARYGFVIPLENGEVEIGITDGPKMLAIIAACRNMRERPPVVVSAATGEPVSEAEIRASVAWHREH